MEDNKQENPLSAQRVIDTVLKCLLEKKEDLDTKECVTVEAIRATFVFRKSSLIENKESIREMLDELPDGFRQDCGGGASFLMACYDRHGGHWGEHNHMESLFSLGVGLGIAKMQFPRHMWKSLPGGMPYYVVYPKKEGGGDNG